MDIKERLRAAFPFGHPGYVDLTLDELQLHNDKNHDYAGGGNPLGNFERRSTIKKLYPGFDWDSPLGTAVDDLLKQFDAAMWLRCQHTQAKVEGIPARWRDIGVYSKIIRLLFAEEEENGKQM